MKLAVESYCTTFVYGVKNAINLFVKLVLLPCVYETGLFSIIIFVFKELVGASKYYAKQILC